MYEYKPLRKCFVDSLNHMSIPYDLIKYGLKEFRILFYDKKYSSPYYFVDEVQKLFLKITMKNIIRNAIKDL